MLYSPGLLDAEGERFCYTVLELQNQCLGFDFIGTAVDESVDDIGTVEVPSSWKTSILEMGNLEMYFDLYAMLSPALQPKVRTAESDSLILAGKCPLANFRCISGFVCRPCLL